MKGAIMTCPQRADTWPIVMERWPGWDLVVDDGRGVVETFCRTMERATEIAGDAEWCAMAQDDADPCPGLVDGLPDLLAIAPPDAAVISGFNMNRKPPPPGPRWRRHRKGGLVWVIFMAARTRIVPDLVAGVRAGVGKHDDERLSRWLESAGLAAYTHIPSLVQHRGHVSVTGKQWKLAGHPRESVTFREGVPLSELLK